MATGHNSSFIDEKDEKMYLVYHTRFNDGGEGHSPRVHQMIVNEDGWPCELPYQTQGETISEDGYDKNDVMTFSAVGQNESVWGVKYFD